jgi:hypothetical protein
MPCLPHDDAPMSTTLFYTFPSSWLRLSLALISWCRRSGRGPHDPPSSLQFAPQWHSGNARSQWHETMLVLTSWGRTIHDGTWIYAPCLMARSLKQDQALPRQCNQSLAHSQAHLRDITNKIHETSNQKNSYNECTSTNTLDAIHQPSANHRPRSILLPNTTMHI